MPRILLSTADKHQAEADLFQQTARQQLADQWEANVRLKLPDLIGETQQKLQGVLQPQQAIQPAPEPPPVVPQVASPEATPPTSMPLSPAPAQVAPPQPEAGGGGDLQSYAREQATRAGIDPELFVRQIQQESGFNPNAGSQAGAQGIAQFMPDTARGEGVDPWNPQQALGGAANLMARYIQQYGGDVAKALAAYNAGPGAVEKYGGVPPFEETQSYVKGIMGGEPAGPASVPAVAAAPAAGGQAAPRASQFGLGLDDATAYAACGPAAAIAFANTYGRNPTAQEAVALAQKYGWTRQDGMAGIESEQKLLAEGLGVPTKLETQVDWQHVASDASSGNPVIISTPNHYFYVSGFNPQDSTFSVGTSGTDLKGGSEKMTAEDIARFGGGIQGALYADNPQSPLDSIAKTAGAVGEAVGGAFSALGSAAQGALQSPPGVVPGVNAGPSGEPVPQVSNPFSSPLATAQSPNTGSPLKDALGLGASALGSGVQGLMAANPPTSQLAGPLGQIGGAISNTLTEPQPWMSNLVQGQTKVMGGEQLTPEQQYAMARGMATGLSQSINPEATSFGGLQPALRGVAVGPAMGLTEEKMAANLVAHPIGVAAEAAMKVPATPQQLADAQATLAALGTVNGRPVGAPTQASTPQGLVALRNRIMSLAQDGASERFWYSDSSQKIKDATQGNLPQAERVAQLVGIYSAKTPVGTNLNNALMAWYQFQDYQGKLAQGLVKPGVNPIRVGSGWQDRTALKVLEGGEWNGRKQNNFYRNLMQHIDPQVYASLGTELGQSGVTVDSWMMRAFDYRTTDARKMDERIHIAAPSGQQYTFVDSEVKKIAAQLGWKPEEAQAAIWASIKSAHEGTPVTAGGYHYGMALAERAGQVSWEASPGREAIQAIPGYAEAPYEQRQAFHDATQQAFVNETGQDILAQKMRVMGGNTFDAVGVYQGQVNPGGQTQMFMPQAAKSVGGKKIPGAVGKVQGVARDAISAYAAAKGILLKQDAVPWTRIFPEKTVKNASATVLTADRALTPQETATLDQALGAALGPDAHAVVSTEHGAWLLNIGGAPNKDFQAAVTNVLHSFIGSLDTNAEFAKARYDSEYIANDWAAHPNGEAYRDIIRASGREGDFRGVEDTLTQRIRSAQEGVASQFGWGGQSAPRAADTTAATAAPLAGRAVSPQEYVAQLATRPTRQGIDSPAYITPDGALYSLGEAGHAGNLPEGAVRVVATRADMDATMQAKPTDAQFQTIQDLASQRPNGYLYWDVGGQHGEGFDKLASQIGRPQYLTPGQAGLGARIGAGALQGGAAAGYEQAQQPGATPQSVVASGLAGAAVGAGRSALLSGVNLPAGATNVARLFGRSVQQQVEHGININLPKYTQPEVRDVIQEAYDTHPEIMDIARRGVIPDEVVADLAKTVGGSVNQIRALWKPGQAKNAETILALRQALADESQNVITAQQHLKANPNDAQAADTLLSSLLRHAAVQEVVTGVTAEAGRALRQFRQEVTGTPGVISRLTKMAQAAKVSPEEFAAMLAKVDITDPMQAAAVARSLVQHKWTDYVSSLWYFNLLSSPASHVRNVVSNSITAASGPVEAGASATLDLARSTITRQPRERFFGEVPARLAGLKAGFMEGVPAGLDIMRHGYTKAQAAGQLTGTAAAREPFKGVAGAIINAPGRALGAEDAVFRSMNKSSALNALAYRQASTEGLKGQALADRIVELRLDPKLIEEANKEGAYRVFQSQSNFAEWLQRGPGWTRFLIPFVRTPVNIAKYMVNSSPAGAGTLLFDVLKGNVKTAGGVEDRLARTGIGSAVMGYLYLKAKDGNLTGAAPQNPTERAAFLREHPEYSFRVGDQWYSYTALQPYSGLFAAAASIADAEKRGVKMSDSAAWVMGSFAVAKSLADQPWTSGLADALDMFNDPERMAPSYTKSLARTAAFPTALMGFLEKATDTMLRDPADPLERFRAQYPGAAQGVKPRIDVWGNPIPIPEAQRGAGALNVFNPTPAKDDPVNLGLAELQRKGFAVEPGVPGNKVTVPKLGVQVELSDQEQYELQKVSGQFAYALLFPIMTDPQWSSVPPEQQAKIVGQIMNTAREYARTQVMPDLMQRGVKAFQEQYATGIRKPAPAP